MILTRHLLFTGNRQDALERLPSTCDSERLELGSDRISLVCPDSRIDVHLLDEFDAVTPDGDQRRTHVLMQLDFSGRCTGKVERFVQCLRDPSEGSACHGCRRGGDGALH